MKIKKKPKQCEKQRKKTAMVVKEETSARDNRKRADLGRILVKEEVRTRIKLVTKALRKDAVHRSKEEQQLLDQSPEVTEEVSKRLEKRNALKERTKEIEDSPQVLKEKCQKLADLIEQSKSLIVYTGAGISTAASIPDYRGPNGVWTLLQKGKALGYCDLSKAEPTVTHMALAQLYKKCKIMHVVSQNCDGLHLRSGLPRTAISEVHGNMLIEVCKSCKPPREYIRLFDVTERTSLHRHKTGRRCHKCNHELVDTIVHFGERGTLKSPMNWTKAIRAVKKCDLILCLGSSLKVLRKYTCLWGLDRPASNRPQLCIVNLQWTPKDHVALLKINGRCDDVITKVMQHLDIEIPPYSKEDDPLFQLAMCLKTSELETTVRKELEIPVGIVLRRSRKVKRNCSAVRDGTTDPKVTIPKIKNEKGCSVQTTSRESCSTSVPVTSKSFKDDHNYAQYSNTVVDGVPSSTSQKPCDEKPISFTNNDNTPDPMDDVITRCSTNSDIKVETSNDLSDGAADDSEGLQNPSPGWFGKGYRKPTKRKKRR